MEAEVSAGADAGVGVVDLEANRQKNDQSSVAQLPHLLAVGSWTEAFPVRLLPGWMLLRSRIETHTDARMPCLWDSLAPRSDLVWRLWELLPPRTGPWRVVASRPVRVELGCIT